jgi:hypothetical protein
MLANIVKPATACREANNNMDTINMGDKSREKDKSREASSARTTATAAGTQNYCRKLWTVGLAAAGTIETSQTSTSEGRPATEGTPTSSNSRDVNNSTISRKKSNSMVANNS